MGEIASIVLKMALRASSVLAVVIAFAVFLGFILSAITVGLNANIIGDLMALVQMWLPFNLASTIVWLLSVATLYLTYRLVLFINELINNFTR